MWVYLYWWIHGVAHNRNFITKIYKDDNFDFSKLITRNCDMCNTNLIWDDPGIHLWIPHEILNPDFKDNTRVWILIKEYLQKNKNHWIFLN